MRDDPVARWSHPAWWIDRVRREYPGGLGNDPRRRQRAAAARAARESPRHDARRAAGGVRASGRRRHAGGRRRASSSSRRGPIRELPGYATRARSRCRTWARSSRRRCCGSRRAARARRLRGARRQDHAHRGARRRRRSSRSTATKRGSRACARTSRACTSPRRACACVAGDAGARRDGGTGVRSIASSPTCRARRSGVVRRHPDVKWLRREADIANFARQQARLLDALWSCLARGRPPALRDLLGLRRTRTRRRSRHSSRGIPRRCANPSPLPPRWPIAAHNSCLRSPARATIKTDSSTRCFASPDGRGAPRGFRPPRRRRPLGTAFDAPPAGMLPAIRSRLVLPDFAAIARARVAARLSPLALALAALAPRRRTPTRSPSSRPSCAPTRMPMCSTRSSSSRSTRRSRKRCRRACRSTSCSSSSSCARAGTGSTRRCCRSRPSTASRTTR